MKIALASDVHLEFGPITLDNTEGADVLVLAGDICVANDFVSARGYNRDQAQEYRKFFDHVCQEFPQVVYIMGNHEHYHGDVAHSYRILREHLDYGNQVYQGRKRCPSSQWCQIQRRASKLEPRRFS